MLLSIKELQELLPGAKIDRRGKNLYGCCPQCNEWEFGISLSENHRFGCFRKKKCGFSGNIFTLLNFLGKSIYDVKPSFEPRATIDIDKLFIQEKEDINLDLPDKKLPIGFKRIDDCEYLNNRGFTKEDYERYQPGETTRVDKLRGFIIFPIYQFGSLKGYVSRNKMSKEEIEKLETYYKIKGIKKSVKRYINSDSDFAKILLGVDELEEETDTVILVEGLFDKQNTDKQLELRNSKEIKCCATFKCGVSAEQIFLLQQFGVKNIILMYDPDVIKDIVKTAWELDNYFNVMIAFNEKGEDPGDMKQEDFFACLDNLKSPSQFTMSKVTIPILRKN